MSKTYTITEEQLQNALFGLETNKMLARRVPDEKLSKIETVRRIANFEGNVSGIAITLALLGFFEEVKQALCAPAQECNAAGDDLPSEEEGADNA